MCARGLAVLAGADEVACVDGGGGELAGLAGVRAVTGAPVFAGLGVVGVGCEVAELLEGVASVAEVVGALCDAFEFPGLDFGSVLGASEFAHLGGEPVDGAVEALDLCVEGVDEAPEEALALVGELCSVGGDGLDQGVEGLLDACERLVLVPDGSVVGFVGTGSGAVEPGEFADGGGRGGGVSGLAVVAGVVEGVHDDLHSEVDPTGRCAPS